MRKRKRRYPGKPPTPVWGVDAARNERTSEQFFYEISGDARVSFASASQRPFEYIIPSVISTSPVWPKLKIYLIQPWRANFVCTKVIIHLHCCVLRLRHLSSLRVEEVMSEIKTLNKTFLVICYYAIVLIQNLHIA